MGTWCIVSYPHRLTYVQVSLFHWFTCVCAFISSEDAKKNLYWFNESDPPLDTAGLVTLHPLTETLQLLFLLSILDINPRIHDLAPRPILLQPCNIHTHYRTDILFPSRYISLSSCSRPIRARRRGSEKAVPFPFQHWRELFVCDSSLFHFVHTCFPLSSKCFWPNTWPIKVQYRSPLAVVSVHRPSHGTDDANRQHAITMPFTRLIFSIEDRCHSHSIIGATMILKEVYGLPLRYVGARFLCNYLNCLRTRGSSSARSCRYHDWKFRSFGSQYAAFHGIAASAMMMMKLITKNGIVGNSYGLIVYKRGATNRRLRAFHRNMLRLLLVYSLHEVNN